MVVGWVGLVVVMPLLVCWEGWVWGGWCFFGMFKIGGPPSGVARYDDK